MTSLVYKPDKVLQKQLSNFIQNNVFVVDDDDGKEQKVVLFLKPG